MENRDLQKLLYALIYSLRVSLLDREAMTATLRVCARKSKILQGWEETYKNISSNPSPDVSQRVDELLGPLEEIVAGGLDEKELQVILKHAQKLEIVFRSYGR
jgi:hypothetical protein